MSAPLGHAREPIYFPLEQGERAQHLDVNQLLPRQVYEKLAEMLSESLPPVALDGEDEGSRFLRERGHATIFLDGNRGTGKTTVMANLPKYLETSGVRTRHPELADAVHVLRPIDPSQLEDGDDLFLNVVVAAVLGDRCIRKQRDLKPDAWRALHESLQSLGVALTGRETQGEGVGLDRLRAFIGSQELAYAVHDFFDKAARLLGKRLIVLPIDDVDTTLHRAFENLEVVRRYLPSPVLLPIVCGDLKLYREVTWRDSLRRLTMDVADFSKDARPIAEDLAHEYLRKVFPLHRRLRMPEVRTFLDDPNVLLGAKLAGAAEPRLSLPLLEDWLRALLAGPVNGHENSRLPIPLPTVRALSQLLSRVRIGIGDVEKAYFAETAPLPETDLMRRISYRRLGRIPARHGQAVRPAAEPSKRPNTVSLGDWQLALLDHFVYEPSAGAVCLVLLAMQHWRTMQNSSVFATPLFQPLRQVNLPDMRYIETRAHLSWGMDLNGRLPDSWVHGLPSESVLPFATPEVGRAVVRSDWEVTTSLEDDPSFAGRSRMLVELVTHHNFYSTSKRATLICSGRIVELVVTSLLRDVTVADIERILAQAPFHSAVHVAATKAIELSIDDIHLADLDEDDLPSSQALDKHADDLDRDLAIQQLVEAIQGWRNVTQVARVPLSPWFVYCAVNKTFNQIPFFTRPRKLDEQPQIELLSDVVASGLSAFNALWAAFASFEKGPLFDLGPEISTVNLLNRRGDFSRNNLYTQNIKPLVDRSPERATVQGEMLFSATQALDSHPLREQLRDFFEYASKREKLVPPLSSPPQRTTVKVKSPGRLLLLELLGLPPDELLSKKKILNALNKNAPTGQSPEHFGEAVLRTVTNRYPRLRELSILSAAIDTLNQKKPDSGAS